LKSEAVLSLTSSKLKGAIDNFSSERRNFRFCDENNISASQQTLIETVIAEAKKIISSLESNFQDDKKSIKISGRKKQSGEIDFHAHSRNLTNSENRFWAAARFLFMRNSVFRIKNLGQ
jgi:hypothetical protein